MRASPNIVPSLRYVDAPAAIEWLCRVFGFERHLVVPGEDGSIRHAQLTLAGGMIILCSTRPGEDELVGSPRVLGGISHGIYVLIPEIDAHYQRVRAAGAEIVMEIADQHYGGRLYTARDPEGYVWNFGSYDPWKD